MKKANYQPLLEAQPSSIDSESLGIKADRSASTIVGKTHSNRKKEAIAKLLESQSIWQGGESWRHSENQKTIKTGYPVFDKCLHYNGWPRKQLIECLQPNQASSGLNLFLPSLYELQQQVDQKTLIDHPIVLINPPYIPYIAGWRLKKAAQLWLIKTETFAETIWTAEQILQSNACLATFIWLLDTQSKQTHKEKAQHIPQLRKLQLAANNSHGLTVLFRNRHAMRESSPAKLRVALNIKPSKKSIGILKPSQLNIHILKQPGGWGGQTCEIPWHSRLQQKKIPAQKWPVFNPQKSGLNHKHKQLPKNKPLTQLYS